MIPGFDSQLYLTSIVRLVVSPPDFVSHTLKEERKTRSVAVARNDLTASEERKKKEPTSHFSSQHGLSVGLIELCVVSTKGRATVRRLL